MRRIHRSFLERLRYDAVFECAGCGLREYAPRPYRFHLGPNVLCPRCGTPRVKRRRKRDYIDPMHWTLLTFLEAVFSGGKLFHCEFCRVQFYDRRRLAPETSKAD